MLKIIVTLAWNSNLFKDSICHYPKPLIEIEGKIMVQCVVDNVKMTIMQPYQFIFIIKQEDALKYTRLMSMIVY